MSKPARTTSIARSIVRSYWWRRLVSYALVNALIAVTIIWCFSAQCAGLAQKRGLPVGSVVVRDGYSLVTRVGYEIPQPGGDNLWFPLVDYVEPMVPILVVVCAAEVIGLAALPFSTRRVRRRLQPLNDLAITAEELGNMAAYDQHKMESLEEAIQSASVDSPHVSTGNKDLESIEVALNGLLRQMQEAKLQQMRFVSDASHELRTPISVIQGYVNMLDRWGKSDEEVLEESIRALKAESQHMQELVEQLLFLARGDSGRNTLQREQLNVAEILSQVWEESRMVDEDHAYVLSLAADAVRDARYEVVGDVAMLKQAMRILVANAGAYSSAHTTITLAAGFGDDFVSFSVEDEGVGMSQQDAAHVFERFYRADTAREVRENGTGLGLSIAQWIVSAHEGRIEVLSREEVGTRFTVFVPKERSSSI